MTHPGCCALVWLSGYETGYVTKVVTTVMRRDIRRVSAFTSSESSRTKTTSRGKRAVMSKTMAVRAEPIIRTVAACIIIKIIGRIARSEACSTFQSHPIEENTRIRDQYIVYIQNEDHSAADIANSVAGIKVLQEKTVGSKAWILVEGSPAALQELSERPEVIFIDANTIYGLSGTRPLEIEIPNGKNYCNDACHNHISAM